MKKKLKEIFNIATGGTPSRSVPEYWKNGTIPWVKIGNINSKYVDSCDEYITEKGLNESSAKLFKKGTILYTIFATLGEVAVLNFDATTNQAIAGLSIKNDGNDINYLYYALKSLKDSVLKKGRGVAQSNINMKILKELEIPLPSKEEQIKIAAELDKIQSAIDNKKQQLSLLDEAVKSKFNELIIENGEWKKEKLGEISESILGKMLDKSKHGDEKKFPYLANFNVKWFDFDLSELNEMPFSEKEMEKFQLKIGDILMCEGGEIGRCAVWNNELQNCYFQKALHRIRVNYDFLNPTYLVHWFKLKCDTNSFDDLVGKGATFKHLTGEKLKTIEVPVPPLSLQNRFANFVQQIDKAKSIAKQQIADLQELLDSKMQQYFA